VGTLEDKLRKKNVTGDRARDQDWMGARSLRKEEVYSVGTANLGRAVAEGGRKKMMGVLETGEFKKRGGNL